MHRGANGFAQFISVERGLGLFLLSVGVTFLVVGSFDWATALYLGVIVFCLWSAVDALNNICDADLDAYSDPLRAQFTKKLGNLGVFVVILFLGLSLALGAFTMIPLVVLFVGLGILFGVLYSVPPFRLRQTVYKPIVNLTVGFVPVLIVAAFFNSFSINIVILALLIGVATSIQSLWEDLGDFASDFYSGSRTVPVILGFRKGLFFTIAMAYCLLPLMVMVGVLFQFGWTYYVVLSVLAVFVPFRIIRKRHILFKDHKTDIAKLHQLGVVLAKDHLIIAIIFTLNLVLSSLLKINPIFF
jgi:4-hydroxybenzoate polyprenyltransferase